MNHVLFSVALIGMGLATLVAASLVESDGVVVCKSKHDFHRTVSNLEEAIHAAPDTSFFDKVDFKDKAAAGGERIQPNTLIVFGDPSLGARVMETNRLASIDLPKKFQVYEDKDSGHVLVAYNPASYFEDRYSGLDSVASILGEIDALYKHLVASTATYCATVEKIGKSRGSHGRSRRHSRAKTLKGKGLVSIGSKYGFTETWEKVLDFIEKNQDVELFFVTDHEANDPEGKLPPTRLAVFGNVPDVGVPLIESQQIVVLDLPLKVLVWKDERSGKVFVTYNEPDYIAMRHNLSGGAVDTVISNLKALFVQIST